MSIPSAVSHGLGGLLRASGEVVDTPHNGAGRVLCAARYGALGASSRLRLGLYVPALRHAGLAVTERAFLPDSYLKALYSGNRLGAALAAASAYVRALSAPAATRQHDLLWIEKEFLPWVPFALERRVLGNTPYVLDFDDAWSLRYENSRSALVRALFRHKFRDLVRGAALTVTANETLYRWAQAQGARDVLLLPTVVDLAHYPAAPVAPEGVFTIGWIGTPLTAAYLDLIAAPLRQLAAEAPLKLLIIGAPGLEIPGVPCESVPWSEATEAAQIARCHAGIMPLPDDSWANGKSGYKLIQYMAVGRPTVASAVGANNRIVLDGETGFLAQSAEDWVVALRALRDSPAMAAQFGAASRARIAQHYCLDVTAPVLTAKLNAILGSTAPRRAQMPLAAPVHSG